jgi:hypothetical protein
LDSALDLSLKLIARNLQVEIRLERLGRQPFLAGHLESLKWCRLLDK